MKTNDNNPRIPSPDIRFEGKQSLKRKSTFKKRLIWIATSSAAPAVVIIAWLNVNINNNTIHPNKTQINTAQRITNSITTISTVNDDTTKIGTPKIIKTQPNKDLYKPNQQQKQAAPPNKAPQIVIPDIIIPPPQEIALVDITQPTVNITDTPVQMIETEVITTKSQNLEDAIKSIGEALASSGSNLRGFISNIKNAPESNIKQLFSQNKTKSK